jgi:hypothetical protein
MVQVSRQYSVLWISFVVLALFVFTCISYTAFGQLNESISRLNETAASVLTNTKELEIGNASYQMRYQISGENQLEAMRVQRDNITLAAEISAVSDGVLAIELPRGIIDSKKQSNADDAYAVFVDGQFVPYVEIMNNTEVRILRIEFNNGSEQIEITGTHIVAEFGPLAAFVLAVSIGSLIIVTKVKKAKNFNDLFKPK